MVFLYMIRLTSSLSIKQLIVPGDRFLAFIVVSAQTFLSIEYKKIHCLLATTKLLEDYSENIKRPNANHFK